MKKRFKKINIEISNICNFQCSFCPPVERNKKMMPLDLFESTIKQVSPLTEMVCFHLMGDPLVHPHLEELVEICKKHHTKIFFVTNGYLLKSEHLDLLSQAIFHQINFSLHSFFDNHPAKDPTAYLEKIFRFTEYAFVKNPQLYINFRLWNLNDKNGSLTDNVRMLQLIEERFNFRLARAIDVTKQKSVKVKNRLYLHFDTEFVWPDVKLPVLGTKGTCYGLDSHIGVHADGTVVPCCLDKEAKIPLGNLADQSLLQILNGERAVSMRDGFKKNFLREDLCQKCQYVTRFNQ